MLLILIVSVFFTRVVSKSKVIAGGRRQGAEGRRQKAVLAGGKTITIPNIHTCHFVLKSVTTAIRKAKKAGLIVEIKAYIEQLRTNGIYIRLSLIDAVLRDVGEIDF
ncbi:MAG: DUF3368 domain-containing protein [Nostoc sp.]